MPPKAAWPRPRLPGLDSWATRVGAILAILVMVVPVYDVVSLQARIGIVAAVGLVLVAMPVVRAVPQAVATGVRRVYWYGHLYEKSTHLAQLLEHEKQDNVDLGVKSDQLNSNMAQAHQLIGRLGDILETLIPVLEVFPIVGAAKSGLEGTCFLLLERRDKPILQIDATVLIIDFDARSILGRFAISEIGTYRYRARAVEVFDGVWWGYMCQRAEEHALAPTLGVAVLMPERDWSNG